MVFRFKQKVKPALKHKMGLSYKIRTAEILEKPEKEFSDLVNSVENNPIFKELARKYRIISYSRFPGAAFSYKFCSLIENISRDNRAPDVESLVEKRQEAVSLVKRIGREKFEKYFLYNCMEIDVKDICAECSLNESEVDEINGLMNDLSVQNEFYHPSGDAGGAGASYYKIASIEMAKDGRPEICFLMPRYAQGRYVLNMEKLNTLKETGELALDKIKGINAVLETIEQINTRKSAIFNALNYIAGKQAPFLKSGDEKSLAGCTQRKAAQDMGIEASVLNRAVSGRSIELPSGKEIPLARLFPSSRTIGRIAVEFVTSGREKQLTDMEAREILKKKHGINVSRRTVNSYRKSLEKTKRRDA
ncbi:MAG: hypothetical protein ABII64_00835 [Elusimicrobiota bacterium]